MIKKEKSMKLQRKNNTEQQEGSVLVIVLIMLALLTLIGVSANSISNRELKTAENNRDYNVAFFQAESGVYGSVKWVRQVLSDNTLPAENLITYPNNTSGTLLSEVLYSTVYDATTDLAFPMTNGVNTGSGLSRAVNGNVTVDLDRRRSRQAAGGSTEFSSGASGTGQSAVIEIPYWFTSEATTSADALAEVSVKYINVNFAGGI